jgi:putative membrane protein
VNADDGFSRERTALAWDRTALAVVCGALVVARLTFDRLGPVAFACLAVALPLAALAGAASRRGLRDGQAPAAVAVATVAIAAVELTALLCAQRTG